MTLDEAIKHAGEVAEEKEKLANTYESFKDFGNPTSSITSGHKKCLSCAEEHRQLAEWLKDYKRLLEREPCDDVISRRSAIDTVEESRRLNNHLDEKLAYTHEYEHRHFLKILADLPSAQPERRGRWIVWYECPNCGEERSYAFNTCPMCGAKMDEQPESETEE